MKEQKLFFTRNGRYTLWEKLNALPENFLYELFMFVYADKCWIETMPGAYREYPAYIYRVHEEVLSIETDKKALIDEVDKYFQLVAEPKSDFNAIIFKYQATSFDMKTAKIKLNALQKDLDEFEIEGLSIEFFCYDKLNGNENVIDVRFTTEKSMFFKQNENKQILNTEIRVYLDYNIALMTNFTEYTHNAGEKHKFIMSVLSCVSTNTSKIYPLRFSDLCLRYLLTISKKLPSKFKFEVEGRLKIGIDIKHPNKDDNALKHDEVKYFYDRYQLSLLKVVLSEEEEKYLTIDGAEGKLISKSQNIDVVDIDTFINKLSDLLKYDYLNDSYKKEFTSMATRELVCTSFQKDIIVDDCYTDVERSIKEIMDEDKVYSEYIITIRNAFFFCIKSNIFYDINDVIYTLEGKSVEYMATIAKKPVTQINKLFSTLMKIVKVNEDNLENFIVSFDKLINDKRMVRNAAGS